MKSQKFEIIEEENLINLLKKRKKLTKILRKVNETHLSTDESGGGDTKAFSFSLFTDEPAVTGAGVDWPAGISSGSSGQPNASFVFP